MVNTEKLVYPAFIQQDDEGMYCVYFPTLFPESGWDFPLSRGETKRKAIQSAKKDLAYSLAGILYDNEELPEPIPIQINQLTRGMELIDTETSFEPYTEEIQEHLKGRHWHISYYAEEYDELIEAIGYKNDQGTWDIFFEDYSKEEDTLFFATSDKKNPEYPGNTLLFTVNRQFEAEEKFNQFVEDVIVKRRTSDEWSKRKKERVESEQNFHKILLRTIDEKLKMGEITEEDATAFMEWEKTKDKENN